MIPRLQFATVASLAAALQSTSVHGESGLLTYTLADQNSSVLTAQFSGSVDAGVFSISGIQSLTFAGSSVAPGLFPYFDSMDETFAILMGGGLVPDLPPTIALDGSFIDFLIAQVPPVFGSPTGDGFTFAVNNGTASFLGGSVFNGGPSFGGGYQESFAQERFSFEVIQEVPEAAPAPSVIVLGLVGLTVWSHSRRGR